MEVVLKPGITLKDRYEIKRAIYQGRAYNFYIVEDREKPGIRLQLIEIILSKIPHKEITDSWLAEQVEFLKELQHPMLPVVQEGFLFEGNAYLVQTYGEGISLDNYVNMNVSPLALEESLERINRLMGVLHYLYDRPAPLSFIHIDPLHINVSESGDMVLMGFGLHLFMDHYLSSAEPDSFCAPEIAEGQAFSQKSAQYTLGTILYYFLTKKKWDSRKKDNPKPREVNKAVPENLQEIITTTLSRMPEYRYLDLDTLIRKIDEVIHPPVPQQKETQEAGVQEEAVFVRESRALRKNFKVGLYAVSGLLVIAMAAFFIVSAVMDSSRARDSLFAYVLYGGRQAIHCLDMKTGNPVKVMSLPGKAVSMNISIDGKRIVVPREEDNFTLLDALQGVAIATYPLKSRPGTMLLSPVNEDAFISYPDRPVVTVWNREAKEFRDEIPMSAGLRDAAISGDGALVAALSAGKEEVDMIDTGRKKIISTFPAGREPRRCALSTNGRLLAITSEGPAVTFFDTQYSSVKKALTVEAGPKYCVFSRGRDISTYAYIACREGNALYAVECTGYTVVQKTKLKGVPLDIKVSPDGKTLYLLMSSPNSLGFYDARSLKSIREMVPGFLDPCSLMVWP